MTLEPVITIWENGRWVLWGAMDAHYAIGSDGYLVTIPLRDIEAAKAKELGEDGRIKKYGSRSIKAG